MRGWPSHYTQARGIEIIDTEGNRFLDFSMMNMGACILGYADPDVDTAVKEAVVNGASCSINPVEEVELAERLCALHPWAQQARFTRSGGEALAVAVRIARAHTGRDKIAVCGYHGWHDWYLATNLLGGDPLAGMLFGHVPMDGVPRSLRGTVQAFTYNDIDALARVFQQQRGDTAAVVMEPQRGVAPDPGYLSEVKQLCRWHGAVLIFDEISSGFRMCCGGVHLLYDVSPDLAVFAKAVANGYAMAAVIGTRQVMRSATQSFISSTHWSERLGPVAALACLKKFEQRKVHEHVVAVGLHMKHVWQQLNRDFQLGLTVAGLPSMPSLRGSKSLIDNMSHAMLAQGLLVSNQFRPSLAHTHDLMIKLEQSLQAYFAHNAKRHCNTEVL